MKQSTKKTPCTNGCVINTLVGGDHAYCECPCHKDLPAIPPSRQRRIKTPLTREMVYER